MGKERLRRLRAFKREVDPRSLFFPRKVIDPMFAARAIAAAGLVEPLVRPFGNSASVDIGERPTHAVRGIPADVAWYAYVCSQCGYCVEECDQFYGRGWESQSPRGKWYWLREYMEGREKWDQRWSTPCWSVRPASLRYPLLRVAAHRVFMDEAPGASRSRKQGNDLPTLRDDGSGSR